MPSPTTTRTIGPLHLEDLEPHRFEDLIRQLLYDFRPWRSLEATGRSGDEGGFDARGWEIVPSDESREREEDDEEARPSDDRLWLIQCKREKSIGPSKLAKYLNEISEADRGTIDGIVFAAACDLSRQARDTFRDTCRRFGFAEGHLWGRGEIEDVLFQPKNDHLLFAYFGVSLQARRRSIKSNLRERLAVKRKATRLSQPHTLVLIRDGSDDRYPHLDMDKGKPRAERGRWSVMAFGECSHDGIRVQARRHFAFIDDDGEHWDFAETMNDAVAHHHSDPWRDEKSAEAEFDERAKMMELWEGIPEPNRAWLEVFAVLPYEEVLAIDEEGDEYFKEPHIYTGPWRGTTPPFSPWRYARLKAVGYSTRTAEPKEETRVQKFPRMTTSGGGQ